MRDIITRVIELIIMVAVALLVGGIDSIAEMILGGLGI